MCMKQGNDMNKRIEQALNSLDGVERAEPQPWLYARIMRKLAVDDDKTVWESIGSFLSRPAVAIVGLCLILVLNGFALFNEVNENDNTSIISEQSVDSESLMASSSSFEYENLVQP